MGFQRIHGGTTRERLQGLDTEDEFRRRAAAEAGTAQELLGKLSLLRWFGTAVSGSYAWHPDMKFVEVTLSGGGGGGGGADTTAAAGTVAAGGGGAAGSTARRIYTRAEIEALNGGQPVPYVVGGGGAGGVNTGGTGTTGTTSTFGGMSAPGGAGGGGPGTSAATAGSQAGGAGGVSSGGQDGHPGGDGSNGFAFSVDGTTDACVAVGGHGGASMYGGGARGGHVASSVLTPGVAMAGTNAIATSAGGGGGVCCGTTSGVVGGNGQVGRIRFVEFA